MNGKVSVYRVSPKLHKLLKVLSEQEERSINNVIQFLLHKALKTHKFESKISNNAIEEYFKSPDDQEPQEILEG